MKIPKKIKLLLLLLLLSFSLLLLHCIECNMTDVLSSQYIYTYIHIHIYIYICYSIYFVTNQMGKTIKNDIFGRIDILCY